MRSRHADGPTSWVEEVMGSEQLSCEGPRLRSLDSKPKKRGSWWRAPERRHVVSVTGREDGPRRVMDGLGVGKVCGVAWGRDRRNRTELRNAAGGRCGELECVAAERAVSADSWGALVAGEDGGSLSMQ